MRRLRLKYQLKSFVLAMICLWTVVGLFMAIELYNFRRYRVAAISNSVDLAMSNIIDGHNEGRDMTPYLNFLDNYLEGTPLRKMTITIYDVETQKLLYTHGPLITEVPKEVADEKLEQKADGSYRLRVYNVKLSDGTKIFLYTQGYAKGGEIVIHAYLPQSADVDSALTVRYTFWVTCIFTLILGTIVGWIFTAHQAKNITLLHDFAERAANDRQFIPMGDYPSDEIGDISRQIVAIYNSRMQANLRREKEHVIALKATQEKNQLKREMTNNVAHELKTPIGIIHSYIEMILANPDMSDADRTHFLTKAQENVERMISMMDDLSKITRLEESKDAITISDIDFHELIFSVAEDLEQSGVLESMDFTYNIPHDCHVYGNGELLIGALLNLAKNAVHYSQGTEIGVSLIGRNDNYYSFTFYDNGTGVDEEHLPHLFDRFYRIDKGRSRKLGGTGLGLPIVKSSINKMGGSITVRNRKGGGLEYIFTLRRVK